MTSNKTVNDVLNTFTKEQYKELIFHLNRVLSDEFIMIPYSKMKIIDTLNKEQRLVFEYILGKAIEEREPNDSQNDI